MVAKGRSRAVDLLKIGMAVMVVGIHANPFQPLGRVANLLTGEGLYRIAVPAFFVISGYFFYNAAQSGRVLPYVRRTGLLFVLWMLIYIPISYRHYIGFWNMTVPGFWRELIMGYWHLWYLSGLTLAAALLGLMHRWSTPALLTAAGATYAVGAAVSWAVAWGIVDPWVSPHLHRNGLTLGLPFLILGYLMRRHDLPSRYDWRGALPLVLAGLLLVVAESLALAFAAPNGVGHDNLLALALAAPALVLLALTLPGRASGPELGLWSSGIYFTHVIPCALLFRFREGCEKAFDAGNPGAACEAVFAVTSLPTPLIFVLTLAGALALTWAILRSGLAPRLL